MNIFFKKVKVCILNTVVAKLPSKIRVCVYRKLLSVSDIDIRKNVYFDSLDNISIGKCCFINDGVKFYFGLSSRSKIYIEDNVYIGMNTSLICVSHKLATSDKRAGENIYGTICIEKGVWIGANVTVLPNVKIGKGCVIAAGAVVTVNCEENGLYAGIPAKRIKNLY